MSKRPRTVWVFLASSLTLHLVLSRVVTRHEQSSVLLKRTFVDPDDHTHEWISVEFYNALPHAFKPFYLVALALFLLLLFTSIGIVASDFFCPNLATVANHLGLSESTAGVTFLAFGNGSPDVFSTYSAVRGGTMGLAVGELIGAASFTVNDKARPPNARIRLRLRLHAPNRLSVSSDDADVASLEKRVISRDFERQADFLVVSIVVGTIALLRPFHVPRYPFIRDVSFFTAAVLLLIAVLADGKLTFWESGGMVVLYIAYVIVVVTGNWIQERKRRESEKTGWTDEEVDAGVEEEDAPAYNASERERPTLHLSIPSDDRPKLTTRNSSSSLLSATPRASKMQSRGRSHSSAAQLSPHLHSSLHPSISPMGHHHTKSDGDHYPLDTPRPAFSLLGAIEFRDVVNSLRESAGNSPNGPGPAGDYFSSNPQAAEGHHHVHGHQQRHSVALGSAAAATAGLATFGMHVDNPSPTHSRSDGFLFPDIHRRRTARNRSISQHPNFNRAASHQPQAGRNSLKVPARSSSGPHSIIGPIVDATPLPIETNPWEDALSADDVASASSISNTSTVKPPKPLRKTHVPRISLVDPSGEQFQPDDMLSPPGVAIKLVSSNVCNSSKRQRVWRILALTCHRLFPSLQSFRHKSWLGRILAVFVTPTVFALTISLPVVEDTIREEGGIALPLAEDEPLNEDWSRDDDESEDDMDDDEMARVGNELHHLIDGTFNPLHSPLGRLAKGRQSSGSVNDDTISPEVTTHADETATDASENNVGGFNKYLTALQSLLGPLLAAFTVFGLDFWVLGPVAVGGFALSCVVIGIATDGQRQPWRILRCFLGFVIAMVWIAAIADHVVDVLQAFGEILGLSDAIVGLTIFAVGNSLADLVANVTVARFAPAMAYAACFGGPMLNLLMGVGSAGTYFMLSDPLHAPIHIEFSPTLWVSSSGLVLILLATAIFVPLNGFKIDRRWACCLIAAYSILMITNVVVEIKTGRT